MFGSWDWKRELVLLRECEIISVVFPSPPEVHTAVPGILWQGPLTYGRAEKSDLGLPCARQREVSETTQQAGKGSHVHEEKTTMHYPLSDDPGDHKVSINDFTSDELEQILPSLVLSFFLCSDFSILCWVHLLWVHLLISLQVLQPFFMCMVGTRDWHHLL